MTPWGELSWSEDALDEALVALARAGRLVVSRDTAVPRPPRSFADDRVRTAWLDGATASLGIESEPVECRYDELEPTLRTIAPALLRLPLGATQATSVTPRWLVIVGATRRSVVVLTPSLARARVPIEVVFSALTHDLERELSARVDRWLDVAGVGGRRARRARRELLKHFLSERTVAGAWLLRADPGSSFTAELRRTGTFGRIAWFVVASVAQVLATVVGWSIVGRGALEGVHSSSWLTTWILLALTAILFAVTSARLGARITLDVASLSKRRLLAGALRMSPDVIRGQGSGRLLGTVGESTAIETAGLTGAIGSLLALVQLSSSAIVLAMGAGGALHVAALSFWCLAVAMTALRVHRRRAAWTSRRLELTGSFVENVVANRTRVAQQKRAEWHQREDDMMAAYAGTANAMDGTSVLLSVGPARGWFVLGLLALVPSLLAEDVNPGALAIAFGGILQAQAAFAALSTSATSLGSAFVAWRSIRPLFAAAAEAPATGVPSALAHVDRAELRTAQGSDAIAREVVMDLRSVSFRYGEGAPILRGCGLTIREGDRVLLEGSSGSGKSTLAAVMVGLRTPQTGHVLLRGLDRATIGDAAWRSRVATAPQFHDNHVLSGSLAFNLLMGRGWPPTAEDRREAEAVCRELGLGALLDRMPSGLDQIVGETGWQLSHGERSRVFLARALLQRSDLVVLDETFGALDPLTLRSCLDVVVNRAPALVVIAHP